jgi:hypothetical protein
MPKFGNGNGNVHKTKDQLDLSPEHFSLKYIGFNGKKRMRYKSKLNLDI